MFYKSKKGCAIQPFFLLKNIGAMMKKNTPKILLVLFISMNVLALENTSDEKNEVIEYKNYQSTKAAKKETHLFSVPDEKIKTSTTNRWYEIERVEKGKKLYNQSCIACHLEEGKGTENWQESLDEGGYPPPPLNGTAHTWHHPLGQLHEVIKFGLIEYGTSMPAWGAQYSDEQILDLIASFQSYWDDETYEYWLKRH